MNALQRAIDNMEEKGMQEDPRYSQLIALRARQGNMDGQRPQMQVYLRTYCKKDAIFYHIKIFVQLCDMIFSNKVHLGHL